MKPLYMVALGIEKLLNIAGKKLKFKTAGNRGW